MSRLDLFSHSAEGRARVRSQDGDNASPAGSRDSTRDLVDTGPDISGVSGPAGWRLGAWTGGR